MKAIDGAINQVSAAQAKSGAFNNRLDAIVDNLNEGLQNMSASRSRILDTDYATESTNLAKQQIITLSKFSGFFTVLSIIFIFIANTLHIEWYNFLIVYIINVMFIIPLIVVIFLYQYIITYFLLNFFFDSALIHLIYLY